jgi:hypothetical protein
MLLKSSVADLVQLAKAKPGVLNYGTGAKSFCMSKGTL